MAGFKGRFVYLFMFKGFRSLGVGSIPVGKFLFLITFLTILMISSCGEKKEVRTMNDPGVPLSDLEYSALHKGDTDAYHRLHIASMDYDHVEFLPIAVTMAHKYNYTKAYYDVYFHSLRYTADVDEGTMSLDSCDSLTRRFALDHLQIAFERNDPEAIREMSRLYSSGKFLPRDTILGASLEKKSDSIFHIRKNWSEN